MSDPSSHPTQEELSAYSLGQLPQERAVAIDSHISECRPCCDTIISLSSDDTFVGLLKEARQLPTDQAVDDGAATASSSVQDVPVPLAEHPRYEIVGLIGKGGMGDVYKARHRKMERTVALKVINRGLVRKAEAIGRFHREVKAAAQLSHPNIVTAYDADQAGEFHFMVMEYVDGVDLSQTVKDRGALPVAEACDYIRQAAIGLQHAHERGMVHRDIKPHNLMVTQDGTVKILDFGLASLAPEAVMDPNMVEARSDLTAAGAIMGTPDFISPEQATDARKADIRSDIYSLGSTLYFLLSGQPPFADGSVMHKLKSHAHAEPEPLESLRDDVPPKLVAVVTKMTAKDPAERYLTPSEVADAMESFLRTWRPGEANLERQDLSGTGNNSGSGGQQPVAGDPNPGRLHMVARFLLYTSLLPIGLLILNEFVPLGLFSGETDWFWYCSLTSIALSTIGGIVLGVHQGMSNIRDGQRINRVTTGQTALIIICLAVSAFMLLNHMSEGKGHIEVTPQSDRMTLGSHRLTIVDTSGEKPAGGTSGTRRDDAAGVTTHFFESANGRYNIELSNEVLTVNGEEHSLEGPYDSIRIVDDRVEITRVVSDVSSGPFKVDGKTGVATGHALGIDFVVAGATGVLTSNQLAAGKPGNTSARLEITLANDVIIRLEMLDADGPISFHLNGIGLGSLTAGDQVAIDDQRKVTVNGIARSDQVAIQGEWRVIVAEDSGRTGPPEAVRDIRVTVTQDELTMEIAGRKSVSTFTLDPSTTPKSIDMITEGRTMPGIYDLQGDTLRICFCEATDERPTVFDSQPDSANDIVLTLKRVKPDKDSTATAGDQNRAGPLSPELARSLIPAAASISIEDFQKLQSNPSRDAIQNECLSLILMTLDVRDQSPEAAGDFRFLVEGLPKPSEIAAAMSPSRSKGYFSIIQPDYITECKITNSTDEIARGKVTFNAPRLYIGSATFEARKHDRTWQIEKFHLPSRQISIVLGIDGNWQLEGKEAEEKQAPDPSDLAPDETPEPPMSNTADVELLPLVQVLHDTDGLTAKRVKIIGVLLVTDNMSGVSSYQISTAKEVPPPRPNEDAYSDREVTFEASFDEEKIINVGQLRNKRVLATGLIYYFPADSESPAEVRFIMDDICEYRPQANAKEEAPKAFLKKAKRLEEQGDFAIVADARRCLSTRPPNVS